MPSINYYLSALGRCGNTFRSDRMAGTGVVPDDQSYLFYICRHPGLSQEALSKALYVHKSHVTRHLAHLEKEGYITRTPDSDDRRVLLVHPTEKAEAILPRLRAVGKEWRLVMCEGFTDEQRATLEELLERAFVNARTFLESEGME